MSFDGVQTKGDFPFFEPLIAPYMSSLDTSEQGHVTYRETNDAQVLNRASNDVRGAFATSQASFNATSVFIVTWKNVCGRSAGGEVSCVHSSVTNSSMFCFGDFVSNVGRFLG